MVKLSTGLFAGTVIGMGVAMLDKRSLRKVKRLERGMLKNMSPNMGC